MLDDYMDALRFLAEGMQNYSFSGGELREVAAKDSEMIFFSRNFLQERIWSVFPLWEGDLTGLLLEDGSRINLMKVVREHCLQAGCGELNYATIDKMKEWWYPDFANFAIAYKKIHLAAEDPSQFFSIRDPGCMPPYVGNNVFWPTNKDFAIYSDGDNRSFFVGDRKKVEGILGISYHYCLSRFIAANPPPFASDELRAALERFSNEQLR